MKNETLTKKTTSSKSGAINGILPDIILRLIIIYKFTNIYCYEKLHFLFFNACTSFFDRKL